MPENLKIAENLQASIYSLLDERNYEDAERILKEQLQLLDAMPEKNHYLLIEVAGSLISLGSESMNKALIDTGLEILLGQKEMLSQFATVASLDYCIGNAYSGLYKISHKEQPGFPTPEHVKEHLFNAKCYFLKAFKALPVGSDDLFAIQVMNNLGLELINNGRYLEALQLLDEVLTSRPDFPYAISAKADCLMGIIHTAEFPRTTNLYSQLYQLFMKSSHATIPLLAGSQRIQKGLAWVTAILTRNDYDFDEHEQDMSETAAEYREHSVYRQFCLDQFLSLSEHALYCKCLGAKFDNLLIGYDGLVSADKKLMRLELVFNNIKSEFFLARHLYFKGLQGDTDDTVQFVEFHDGSNFSLSIEQVRTAFRLCFGILDKIAKAVCYLFELETGEKESVYFESFWNSRNIKTRWADLNKINNIHLTALYSIAADLNTVNGELSFYKTYRNQLEHNVMLIRNGSADRYDLHQEDGNLFLTIE
ncbi:hypothetical protein FHW88_000413 [Mucilaginibacter sp. SG538B]|uniref:LA2681 family HEPN domain-containing protein n=1 Tax=Mucilaginibacter sp. SG538B TaxID=2587021 RepID=UPI00159E5451|nr:LA2681 family HEPN domain-containing protein [Mucilaginibacter sp. SG538B]NVM62137.1 hypothetical protein [Mucilaginibacter sp. SG538B]